MKQTLNGEGDERGKGREGVGEGEGRGREGGGGGKAGMNGGGLPNVPPYAFFIYACNESTCTFF